MLNMNSTSPNFSGYKVITRQGTFTKNSSPPSCGIDERVGEALVKKYADSEEVKELDKKGYDVMTNFSWLGTDGKDGYRDLMIDSFTFLKKKGTTNEYVSLTNNETGKPVNIAKMLHREYTKSSKTDRPIVTEEKIGVGRDIKILSKLF